MRTSLFDETMPERPSDAEVENITRYTAGLMTVAEARRFEDRLTNDIAFFYRTAPMLKLWYARKPNEKEGRLLRGEDVPLALVPRSPATVRPVRQPRWLRLLAGGGLTIAAEILFLARISTEVAPEMWPRAPVKPHATLSAPPTQAKVAVTPKAPRHEAPTVVASATVDSAQAPRMVTVDSATARVVAAMDSAQAAAEFIPSSRVADTVDASGLQRTPVYVPPQFNTTTQTEIGWSKGSAGAGALGSKIGGVLGTIKDFLGGVIHKATGGKS
jgi:hypothetical protein